MGDDQREEGRESVEVVTDEQYDQDKLGGELRGLLSNLQRQMTETITEIVTKRTRRWKKSNAALKAEAQKQRTVAEQRKSEIDGQVQRARNAEARVKELTAGRSEDRKADQAEVARLKEIIGEQSSTIKAQATALRAAEKKLAAEKRVAAGA